MYCVFVSFASIKFTDLPPHTQFWMKVVCLTLGIGMILPKLAIELRDVGSDGYVARSEPLIVIIYIDKRWVQIIFDITSQVLNLF